MKLAIAGLIGFCVVLIGGAVFYATRPSAPQLRILPMNEQYTQRVENNAWTKGATNATVVLTEYADFQCPGCAAMVPIVNEVLSRTDFVRLEYRNYPLTQHNKARLAAKGAEAAGRQGKYWDMHGIIFANQANWEGTSVTTFRDTLKQYAQSLNLNVDQFMADVDDKSLDDIINKDVSDGNRVPVTGTPTFQVNGTKLEALPKSADEFIALLEAARPQ